MAALDLPLRAARANTTRPARLLRQTARVQPQAIAQEVEPHLLGGSIGDVFRIGGTPVVVFHIGIDAADT